jgi:hypothetical protein
MDSSTVPSKTRQVLPPHTNPSDAELYLASCTKQERDLVTLAIKELGSSYFMEKSHGYKAWKDASKPDGKK